MAEYNIIKTQFCMDVLPGEYDGFTRGDLWNGWECPIFEKAVAETILKDITSNGYSWKYNPEEDAFLVQHEDDPNDYEPEIFAAEQVVLDNGDVRNLYAIGAYAWIWEKCSEQQQTSSEGLYGQPFFVKNGRSRSSYLVASISDGNTTDPSLVARIWSSKPTL